MPKTKLSFSQQIKAPLSYVFYLFNNKSGWKEWLAHKAYGYTHENALLRVFLETEENYAFYFTAEKPERRIAFDLINLDTAESSQVEVSFDESDGLVTVSVNHSGIPEGMAAELSSLWETALANLKSVVETGKDLRVWNRPVLGVSVEQWITPETAAEQGLPVSYGMQLSSLIPGRGAEAAGLQKGDIIVSLAGREMSEYKQFLVFLESVSPGDTVDFVYYRGEEQHTGEIKLMAYPFSEPPATAHDYAERIARFYEHTIKKLNRLFEDINEAQLDYRPGPGEWSARELLGHLISFEADIQTWISTLVAGYEVFPCSVSHSIRIKSLLALYPTAADLMVLLEQRQKETVGILLELPAEFVNRKGSFSRLTNNLKLDLSKHYKEHLNQIKESLEKAENVRST